MGSLTSWFNWGSGRGADDSLPDIFPLPVPHGEFVRNDTQAIYTKILTDVFERTEGLSEEEQSVLWDNCLASEMRWGLITRLAWAMSERRDLFLVYNVAGTGVLREATPEEKAQIEEDYKKTASSKVGIYISFKEYKRTDFVRLYSALEYCTIGALNKQMNLSKALQLKFSDLRASVAAIDSADVKAQAVKIAQQLGRGGDVMLDAKDMLELAEPKIDSVEASMAFINEKRAFYLGMPESYITGAPPKGLGDSGEGDAKAIERGLKNYFVSIVKPVCKALFGKSVTFKSEDFRQLTSALEAMKTFEIVTDELMSQDNKRIIVNKLFGLPPETKGDKVEAPPANSPSSQPQGQGQGGQAPVAQ